jgi:hypothetical protein
LLCTYTTEIAIRSNNTNPPRIRTTQRNINDLPSLDYECRGF